MKKIQPPSHGFKQTTDKGNLLVCIETSIRLLIFYITPDGKYLPGNYTKNTGSFLNRTEWNFLGDKTEKVEKMTDLEIQYALALVPCIIEDRFYPWTFEEASDRNLNVLNLLTERSNTALGELPAFTKLKQLFV